MRGIGKITPEQLRTARRILRDLPVKDTRSSREEAAALLEKDFQRAFRNGYTPEGLCDLLKKTGITIPEPLIARYQEPLEEGGEKGSKSGKQASHGEKCSSVQALQSENVEAAKDITTLGEVEDAPMTKPEPVRYGMSSIIPDTLMGSCS